MSAQIQSETSKQNLEQSKTTIKSNIKINLKRICKENFFLHNLMSSTQSTRNDDDDDDYDDDDNNNNNNNNVLLNIAVSVLASGTQDRGFKPGRSLRIFRAKNSSAHLPSEGK
jgi:hypothetical protein